MAAREVVEVVIVGKNRTTAAFSGVVGGLGKITAAAAGVVVAGAAVVAAVGAIGFVSAKTAISVESAFAGILKTTEGLGDSFRDLTPLGESILKQYRDMAKEIPATLEELMRVGELAGQLGVPEEALAGFTRVIADLGASTDLMVESASIDLARFQNIFDVAAEDIVKNTGHIGSTIVDLGNNFATTEPEIVNFALRIASAGKIAGFAQPEIFAIGTAFSSVGVGAERGGTAVQKVIIKMSEAVASGGKDLDKFAEVAGLSADEFIEAWGSDPAEAFVSFVEGLGDSGEKAFGILDELGLKDQRLIQGFLAVAGAEDLLRESVDAGNAAWEENNALTEEAAKRYATTEAQLEITKNRMRDIGLTIGSFLLPAINDLLKKAAPRLEKFGEQVAGAIETGVASFADFEADPDAFIRNIIPEDFEQIFDSLLFMLDDLAAFWEQHGPGISESANAVFAGISEGVATLSENIAPFVSEVLEKFGAWFLENGPLIEEFFGAVSDEIVNMWIPMFVQMWEVVEPILTGIVDLVLNMAEMVMLIATDQWPAAWALFNETVASAGEAIWQSVVAFLDLIAMSIGGSLEEIGATWSANWEMFKEIMSTAWDSIVVTVEQILAIIKIKLDNFAEGMREAGLGWLLNLAEGIMEGAGDVIKAITGVMSDIMSAVGNFEFPINFTGGGGGSSSTSSSSTPIKPGVGGGFQALGATGLSGVIPPGFPDDSFGIGVTSGEYAMVVPRGGFNRVGASSGGAGQAPVNITLVYSPAISFADQYEVERKFTPIIEDVIRKTVLRET